MSKVDPLSSADLAEAAAQGWTVCDVCDLGSQRIKRLILPTTFKPPFTSAARASRWVINRAQQGDKLALRALQNVMQGNKA